MKLRNKTNTEICEENDLPYTMLTNVVEEKHSRDKMRATSELIAKALIATLGPYGSSTIIQDREGRHFATKDGYDLMNRISYDDEVSRTILDLFRTTASNQVFNVGDGSTSAIVVANALFQALTDSRNIEKFQEIAPKDITDMLNDIASFVEEELKKMAIPVSEDMSELDIIAAIANNNDHDAGEMIGNIYRKVGEYGFISMDVVNKQEKDSYEIKSGVEWGRGYIDPLFARDYKDGKIAYNGNVKVILSNSTLTYDDLELGLLPLMKAAFNQEDVELIIVANDFDADVIDFLRANRTKHMMLGGNQIPMNFTAVDIDQVTAESRNKLEDLALLCGCKIYNKLEYGKGSKRQAEIIANPEQFIGRAKSAVITPKTTQIITENSNNKAVQEEIKDIDSALKKLSSIEEPTKAEDDEIYELRQRRSRLTGSSAILHVGGRTMAERMTRQRLIEDAVFACKSAIKYGYIPGGNICIPKILGDKKNEIINLLKEKYNYLPVELDEFFSFFIDMIKDAFLESYRAVLNNSRMKEEKVEETIKECLENNKFYNLKLHRFENFNETEVINSVDTDIQILKSCISLIGILALSNQFITLNLRVTDQIKK